jgi:hypothetical protein
MEKLERSNDPLPANGQTYLTYETIIDISEMATRLLVAGKKITWFRVIEPLCTNTY